MNTHEWDPQQPERYHVVQRINDEETIVGLTTLSLGSKNDPTHIASFVEVVGTPENFNIAKQPGHERKAKFDVFMLRYSQGNADPKKPNSETIIIKREWLFKKTIPVNAYNALDDGKVYVQKKLTQRAEEVAELENLFNSPPQEKG